MRMSFLLPFLLFFGEGVESIVDSSLSCEGSRRMLTWDLQYDSHGISFVPVRDTGPLLDSW